MILVTGATGMLGAHFLLELTRKQQSVRAIYRSETKRDLVASFFTYHHAEDLFSNIEWISIALDHPQEVEEALEGIELVIHCAALISFDAKDEKKLFDTNVSLTRCLVDTLLAKPARLLYVSSVAALETEDPSYYGQTKYLGELEVFRGIQEGLEAHIVRPGVILSDFFWKSPSLSLFKLAFRLKHLCFEGETGFIAADDVVQCSLKLIDQKEVNDVTLVSHHMSYCELINTIREGVGKPLASKAFSKDKLLFLMRLTQFIKRLGFRRLVLSRGLIETLYTKTRYDSLDTYEVFSSIPQRDFKQFVKELAVTYKREKGILY